MLRLWNRSSARFGSILQQPFYPETYAVRQSPFSTSAPHRTELSSTGFFKTSETNPDNLNSTHLGRFYSISDEVFQKLYIKYHGFPKEFRDQCKVFREQCVLVRKPYLELKTLVDSVDLKKPAVRFIIYGETGVGKSMTLASMVHYGYVKEFILFNIPWLPLWTRFCKEIKPSVNPNRPEMHDHTVDLVNWLGLFKSQNSDLIQKLDLRTLNEYQWSQREVTPAGSSVLDIVEHGISRPVHAMDTFIALIRELKQLSSAQKCKTMILVDGANDIFYESRSGMLSREGYKIRYWLRTMIPYSQITLYGVLKDLFKPDWSGGVTIVTVDITAIPSEHRKTTLPRQLLTQEGWELFDPFVPIEVQKYSSQEIQTTLDYYLERKWLQHPGAKTEEGRLELEYLSTRNPLQLLQLCNSR